MASKRFIKCSVCDEAKSKLTKVEGKLYCTQCMEQMMVNGNKSDPQPESNDVKIEHGYGIVNTQLTDSLGQPIGPNDLMVRVKEELDEEDHSTQDPMSDASDEDIGRMIEKYYENPDSDINIKDEIEVEETQVNIDDGNVEYENTRDNVICIYCGLDCKTERKYRFHARQSHPDERKVNCSICYFTCKGETIYRKHLQEEHDGFECMCKICHEMYNASEGKKHKPLCMGRLLFQCISCKGYYGKKQSLWKHLDEHGILESTKESSFTEHRIKEKFYSCKICEDDRAYSYGLYWKHIQVAHQGHHLTCKHCPKTFTSTGTRSAHSCVPTNPTSDPMVSESSQTKRLKKFKCSECPKTFQRRYRLNDHVQSVHRLKASECDVCGEKFKTGGILRYHKATAHSDPRFFCLNCNKKFKFIKNYRNHFEMHEERRETERRQNQCKERLIFQCKLCKANFGDKESLWKHLDGHGVSSDDRTPSFTESRIKEQLRGCKVSDDGGMHNHSFYWEYNKDANQRHQLRCRNCHKIYKSKCLITNDKMTFCDDETPIVQEFKCPHCPKIYNKSFRLTEHIKEIHAASPVTCEICGFECKTRKQYGRHKVIAHTEPRYQCSVCQRKFHYKSYCQSHKLSHRKEKDAQKNSLS